MGDEVSEASPQGEPGPEVAQKTGHDEVGDDAPLNGVTPRQDKAVEALLHEPTIGRAAAAAGVGERTLRRWLKKPVFRAAVLAARREAFSQAIGLTQRYAPVAVATLVKVMQDATVNANAKVTAAAVLPKFGREGIELDDLAERVEALERAMPPLQPQLEDKR